jgi:hypothetical protein
MALGHLPIQNSEVYLLHAPSLPLPEPRAPSIQDCSQSMDELIIITPPDAVPLQSQDKGPLFKQRLSTAVHIFGTEAKALSYLADLYATDPIAQGGFNSAVEAINDE